MLVTELGIAILGSAEQPLNARSPMVVTELGRLISERLLQPENAAEMDVSEPGTIKEYIFRDVCHGVAYINTGESSAFAKCIGINNCDGVRDIDAGKTSASLKCTRVDGGNSVRDMDAGEMGTLIESAIAYHTNGVCRSLVGDRVWNNDLA